MALSLMDMARIHALSFTTPRPWSEAELGQMGHGHGAIDLRVNDGFLLGRVIADEAELLTVAVHPDARRAGIGRKLTQDFLTRAQALGAVSAFLEVSAKNAPACALYTALGFDQVGQRAGYYGAGHDALVLRCALGTAQTGS